MKERGKDGSEDPRLHDELRQWEVEGAPRRLDARVIESYRAQGRARRWRWGSMGTVRVPLPAMLIAGALLVMAGYVAGKRASTPQAQPPRSAPARETHTAGLPLLTTTPLAGFQPVDEVRVRLLPREENR